MLFLLYKLHCTQIYGKLQSKFKIGVNLRHSDLFFKDKIVLKMFYETILLHICATERNNEKIMKRIFNITLISLILAIIIWMVGTQLKESNVKEEQEKYNAQNLNRNYDINIEKAIQKEAVLVEKEYPKETIITKYKGYDVIAKLEISNIKLKTYILKNCTEASLNKAVAKFWGANPNEEGNLCVAGHNAPRNSNMFYKLKQLKIGDELTISDNKIGKVEYVIYDIYTVTPDDVSCIKQDTNGKKEVTLITCTNNSKKRYIVKATEKL